MQLNCNGFKTSCPPDICYSRAICFNLRVISHIRAEAPEEGDTPDLSLPSVMRVCTRPVFLVPSRPVSCPARICVCAAALLFRPVTTASWTVSSSPSDSRRGAGSDLQALWPLPWPLQPKESIGQWVSGAVTLVYCPKISPPATGLRRFILTFLLVPPLIHPIALSPPPVCGLCSFADHVQPHLPLIFLFFSKQNSVDPVSGP